MFDPCIDINTPRNKDDSHPKLCPFDAAIMATGDLVTQCVRDVATTKANKRNGVGVILYGINYFHDMDRHGDLTSNFPLLPLEPPGIHQIQLINKCISKQRDLYNEFCDPQKKTNDRVNLPHPLRAALHAANKTFQYAKYVQYLICVFLITFSPRSSVSISLLIYLSFILHHCILPIQKTNIG